MMNLSNTLCRAVGICAPVISIIGTSTTADACLARIGIPKVDMPEHYHAIFIARVEAFS